MPATKKATSSSTESRSSSKTSGSSSSKLDAIKLLTQDHKEVKKLFDDYDKLVKGDADADEREALAQEICEMLTLHATIEEELFYPQAREALGDNEDLIDEATVEHASAKELIAQIEESSPDEELYDAKVKVLSEYIQHHVKEEEGEIFPKIKKAELDLLALGEEMAQRKEVLQSSFAR
ncbi:hemerythrin domain-containing protein [Ideonella sp. DXS29W]|uniref:Hemerythrin domain-containing protein n=1 Tax=Ideonella lacteola TaxID=2984193 RepID=A0ABU9BHN5_9BURK